MHQRHASIYLVLLGSISSACYERPTYVPPTPMPSEQSGAQSSRLPSSDPVVELGLGSGPILDRMTTFAARVAGEAESAGSIGCFPFVSYDLAHDGPHDGPWVSELGESLADHLARELAAARPTSWVLAPRDLALRAASANLPREALSTLDAVRTHGARLGVDVLVFGTIRRREDSRVRHRSELVVEVSAYDLQRARIVAQDPPFAIGSDNEQNAHAWRLATEDGTWLPARDWPIPESEPTFDRELVVLCEQVAQYVATFLTAEEVSGKVYIPPTDTSRFVQSTATLRAAQASFARELERRREAAALSGEPVDSASPMVLGGVEFPSLQVAEAYLTELREDLTSGPALRFAKNVSDLLAQTLLPTLTTRGLLVNDLGFTKWSDTQLVEGELALGGLARSEIARDALSAIGVSHVVAPRIDALGQGYQLRVEVLDLGRRSLVGTTFVPISPRFADDLRRELDAAALVPLPPVRPSATSQAGGWDEVYSQAVDGVVLIHDAASGRAGTGFLVSKDGLVMTNSHVVAGMSPQTVAVWKDGVERKLTLVEDAPELDLAVLQLASVPKGGHVFEFAEAKDARVGREVATIGNPKGTSGWVITEGILSSIDERVVTTSGAERASYMYTCATRKGNSGSPVLLRDGRVIAVNSHGALGDIYDVTGTEVQTSEKPGGGVSGELPGFARGAPAHEAQKLLARARTRG